MKVLRDSGDEHSALSAKLAQRIADLSLANGELRKWRSSLKSWLRIAPVMVNSATRLAVEFGEFRTCAKWGCF